MDQPKPVSIRRFVLLASLRLSMIWDLVTTFIGILLILDSVHPIAISLGFVGTLVVVSFNFITRSIWRWRRRGSPYGLQILLLKVIWCMAIVVDLWTSLTCNAWFISPNPPQGTLALLPLLETLAPGQLIIVVFVTLITGISPMLVGYLRDRDIDLLLD